MPWVWKSMKDVITCDKLRLAGNKLWAGDLRMRKLDTSNVVSLPFEYIEGKETYVVNWNILLATGKENK